MKNKTLIVSIIMIIIMLVSISITVYAWISYTEKVALVTVQSGYIEVNVKANNIIVIDEVEIDANSLTYVDFTKDIAEDRTNTLNVIATSIKFNIENSEGSISVKNKIDLSVLDNQSLIYILLYEGKNILPSHEYISDYYSYITTIFGTVTNETLQRQLIASANQGLVDTISEIVVDESESLSFQLVLWGDYDNYTGSNYLEEMYLFNVVIETIQFDGEFS